LFNPHRPAGLEALARSRGPAVPGAEAALLVGRPRLLSEVSMRYALLWLLGVPIPVLIVVYLMFH
jgi:hypothetical protein